MDDPWTDHYYDMAIKKARLQRILHELEITKEEAISQLLEAKNYDVEGGHMIADKILIKFLRSLGYDDVCDAWEQIDKWYS